MAMATWRFIVIVILEVLEASYSSTASVYAHSAYFLSSFPRMR